MKIDILIKNGQVIDSTQELSAKKDIGVKNGRIINVDNLSEIEAERIIDATGCIVTAGLIDSHAHVFDKGCDLGIPADLVMLPYGVTTVGEGGSSGVSNFRSCLEQLSKGRLDYKILLNVSPTGIATFQFPETVKPEFWDIEQFKKSFDLYGEKIMGLKLRISDDIVGDKGFEILEKVIELAWELKTKISVHVTATSLNQGKLVDMLRKDDIYCHVYQGYGETIFDENGELYDAFVQARKRGVIFDAASGKNNFSFDVAQKAINIGFLPDVICSDVSSMNYLANYVGIGLPYIMSKFLAMGVSLEQTIKMSTENPAKVMGIEDTAGSLKEGRIADIAIFKLKDGDFSFIDSTNKEVKGNKLIAPVATIQKGDLLYKNVLL